MYNTANIEALLNILANGVEIAGFSGGIPLLILCFIPYSSGLRGYTSKIAILGFTMAIVGLAFPGVLNWLVGAARDSNNASVGGLFALFVAGLVTLLMLAAWLVGYFLPSIIAYREKRKAMKAMIVCNIFGFIPLVWLVNYIWVCMPPKVEQQIVE